MLHGRADYNRRIQDSNNIIPAGEPVFLLRAQDGIALATVRFYLARLLEQTGPGSVMYISVQKQVKQFEEWVANNKVKVPDCPDDFVKGENHD